MSNKKDITKLIKDLKKNNWVVEVRKNHYMAYPPDKNQSPVTISVSPSDHHAYKNAVSDCKKRDPALK